MKIPRILHLILVLLLVLVTACQAQEPADRVTLQLKWVHQAQFAGYYVALEKGFYQDENIDLEILPAGPGIDYFKTLEDGDADFAVVRPEGIFLERQKGNLIKAVATIYQKNPFLMISLKESGITTPYDFPGKTIALQGTDSDAQFTAMLTNLEIDLDSMQVVPFTFDYTPFYAGEVDVMPSFAAGSLLDVEREGVELNYIWPSDYGVHWYSDTIAASDNLINNDPDLVTRFLRATLKGHQYLFTHPEEAVEITLKYAGIQDAAVQMAMLEASLPLIHTSSDLIGMMDPDVWLEMHNDLVRFGYLSEPQQVSEAYTLDFLDLLRSSDQ